MSYVWLFLFLEAMWFLVSLAAAGRVALTARAEGAEPGGVSILAYVTVPPAAFTGLGYAIDRARPPAMGTWVMVGVHVFIGTVALVYVVRSRLAQRARD